jgi:two-component system, sensor histidine kinase and response regulator
MMERLRLLVVDDEQGMRVAVARAIQRFTTSLPEFDTEIAFDVTQAASAEDALEAITANVPDLLLLDHKLPQMSGLELMTILGERRLDCLVVMMTAYASLETAVTATKRGAYDFLAKPFTPEELKATVRKAAKHLMLQREARRLALEKHQIRFQFISVLVHELKAPLAAIQGYLYIMKNRAIGEEIGSYENAIDRSMIRLEGMRKLIMDLLDLTRIESGQKKRELVDTDVREIAGKAIDTVLPDATARQIEITLEAIDGAEAGTGTPAGTDVLAAAGAVTGTGAPARAGHLHLMADPGEIEIVLNNLVTNAVKYNRDGGSVRVTLAGDEQAVTIRVADTGIGMSKEETAKLFGEFVRIKNDKTRGIMGSGLGLSILKRIAQLYGGEVTVESEPDVGSVFTVVLRRGEAA